MGFGFARHPSTDDFYLGWLSDPVFLGLIALPGCSRLLPGNSSYWTHLLWAILGMRLDLKFVGSANILR